jgi:hypothetical protein
MPISILRTLLIRVGQTKRKEFIGKSRRILSVQQAPIIISKNIITYYFTLFLQNKQDRILFDIFLNNNSGPALGVSFP